ncbi:hypothetical protein ACFOY8_24385 [Thalassospira xianhensis]|uniref:Uncharacterized protein n=1 Tax=Thalassospira xianhensis MCCC 1A02616 TaxID=1177929 RepID=A0A367U721_9PROT|nr:transcriptional regulator [Thalassospira xianhensis]RCK03889.1 hypothetical protein TH5_22990 [Thalassospira xianhensis MCCC 1A02616]
MNTTRKPIRTDADYQSAPQLFETLSGAEPDSPEADQLEKLGILIDQYETARFSVSRTVQ